MIKSEVNKPDPEWLVIPMLKVYTSSAISFNKFVRLIPLPPDEKLDTTTRNLNNNFCEKGLSVNSERKIKKNIQFIADTAKWKQVFDWDNKCYRWFKLGFLTLTLPAPQLTSPGIIENEANAEMLLDDDLLTISPASFKYSDIEIKQRLDHFLTILREKYKLNNYVWKAEAQENGNIHFHIIIDIFIHFKSVQYIWNRCLSVGTSLIDDFEKKWGHRNPPTTKIHAIKNIHLLKNYFCKYMLKSEEDKRLIEGRKWGCSEFLSSYKGVTIELNSADLETDASRLNWIPSQYIFNSDFFKFYRLNIGQIATILDKTPLLNEIIVSFQKNYNLEIVFKT